MADKDIKINFTTKGDTSGAKAVEAALKDVDAAAQAAADNPMAKGYEEHIKLKEALLDEREILEGVVVAMDKAAAAAKEMETELAKVEKELKDVTEAGVDANEQGSELEKNVEGISRAQKGQVLAQLAEGVGKIAGKFREAADEVEAFDKEAAASFRQTADRIDGVTSAVTSLALGFAAGGPIGAGVAAVGIAIGALVNAYKDAEVAAIKSAAEQRKALEETAEAAREAASEASELRTELESASIERALKSQNDIIKDRIDLLNEQLKIARQIRREEEEVLKAEDMLKLAEIDQAEAKGEISPVEAEKQRQAVSVAASKRADEERKKVANEDAEMARKKAQSAVSDFEDAEKKAAAQADKIAQKESQVADARRREKNLETGSGEIFADNPELRKMSEKNTSAVARGDEKEAKKTGADYEAKMKELQGDAKSEAERLETEIVTLRTDLDTLLADKDTKAKTGGEALTDADNKEEAARNVTRTVDRRSAIDEKTRGVKNETGGIRRQKEEEARKAMDAEREAREAARKKEQQAREAAREVTRNVGAGAAGRGGRRAQNLVPVDAPEKLQKAIDRVAESKEEGGGGAEIKTLVNLITQLADVVEKRGKKTDAGLENLQSQINKMDR